MQLDSCGMFLFLQIAEREDLEQLSRGCSLGHMISYDDADKDGRLNINEFYMAFSKLYSKNGFVFLDGGQHSERPNGERPIFWNFEI